MRRIWTGCVLALLIPYVVTLAWSGTIRGNTKQVELISGKKIILDQQNNGYMDVEEYLVGVVGRQIPADYEPEALKAQAIIARTYIYKQMGNDTEIPESALNMDYLEEEQLEKLWGSDKFVDYYQNIQTAVEATSKMVMTYEGNLIDPLFHRASAGRTRGGDEYHPYLESVESLQDVEAEDYLTLLSWDGDTFVAKINEISTEKEVAGSQVPESIQLVSRDEAGYIGTIQIGNHTYTGEEIQKGLGLPSSCFTLEGYEGQIRAVCKGIGHGYGMSQYGARVLAAEGKGVEEILTYYFKNIELISW